MVTAPCASAVPESERSRPSESQSLGVIAETREVKWRAGRDEMAGGGSARGNTLGERRRGGRCGGL
jgi:hypothetical protein